MSCPESRRRRRSIVFANAVCAGLVACAPRADAPRSAVDTVATAAGLRVETIAQGLEVPWDMEFAPDGRIFVTERPGRVRVIQDGRLVEQPWAEMRVAQTSFAEAGLMGMALDPAFATNHRVYLCHSFYLNEQGLIGNHVVAYREQDGRGVPADTLLDSIPGALFHDGCRLAFGPDGKLYITMGDARLGDPAQDPGSLSGKILRLNPDGSIPADNPFPKSPVWSFGHRNPQGLAFQPGTGRLFETEHGSDGLNEINLIESGKNYGWPLYNGDSDDPRFMAPLWVHDSPPAGATFITSDRYPEWRGDLIFAGLALQQLVRVRFNQATPPAVTDTARMLTAGLGRLREVKQGPDGYLYVTTSNRDGRGFPRAVDDRILKLVPTSDTSR